MSNIKLARVDDRLIHGQVVTNWVQFTNATRIVIIDDATANDPFLAQIITMAAPSGIKLDIYNEEEAAKELQEIKEPSLLLAKTPTVYLSLVEKGIEIPAVNLGGMGANKDRTKFYKNISASEDEKKAMESLIDSGVPVTIQIISSDRAVPVTHDML